MEEVLVLTSSKDAPGMGVINPNNGTFVCTSFKNCIADAGTLCSIGGGSSSYSGIGNGGDFIAVAQSKKPAINVWHWGKAQVHHQCHVQEIATALASDSLGQYLIAGTKKGWVYIWDFSTGELLSLFQAHFKAVTRVKVSKNRLFCVTVSEDGMGKAWQLEKLVDVSDSSRGISPSSVKPYRAWSCHTLPVTDLALVDYCAGGAPLRALSCSLDRSVVLYDIFSGRLSMKLSFPAALQAIAISPCQDFVCVGASSGDLYIIDLTIAAVGISAVHASIASTGSNGTSSSRGGVGGVGGVVSHATRLSKEGNGKRADGSLPAHTSVLQGHTKAVTSICFSGDNSSLVTASEDGTVRMWNFWTRQCTKEVFPLGKCAISNAMLIRRPQLLVPSIVKPFLFHGEHLQKYPVTAATTTTPGTASQPSSSGGGAGGGSGKSHHASRLMLGPSLLALGHSAPDAQRKRTSSLFSATAATALPRKSARVDPLTVRPKGHSKQQQQQQHVEELGQEDEEEGKDDEQKAVAEKEEEEEDEEESDDFVAFDTPAISSARSTRNDSEERITQATAQDAADDAATVERAAMEAELVAAREEIAQLRKENTRWEGVCERLKSHIAASTSTTTTTTTAGAGASGLKRKDG